MEPAGWLLLALSWGTIFALVLFCVRRLSEDDGPPDGGSGSA
jgi:hypothetical protein